MACQGPASLLRSYAVTVLVQTRFEPKLVGRPGLEPGTTGLKVHLEFNGDRAFQHPPSPILARLRRAASRTPDRLLQPGETPNPISRNSCQHNATICGTHVLPCVSYAANEAKYKRFVCC